LPLQGKKKRGIDGCEHRRTKGCKLRKIFRFWSGAGDKGRKWERFRCCRVKGKNDQ